jgi:hypothetical protein
MAHRSRRVTCGARRASLSSSGRPAKTQETAKMAQYATTHRIPMVFGPRDGASLPRLGNEEDGDQHIHHENTERGEVLSLYVFDGRVWRFAKSWRPARTEDADGCFGIGAIEPENLT